MEHGGYSEEDLVSNRSALLLYGGNEEERRSWAHEAAANFATEGPLVEVRNAAALTGALRQVGGIVYLPDALALGLDGQAQVLRCLQEREERPKIVIGLSRLPDEAIQQGLIREDLSYRLRLARVNLDGEGLREAIHARREKLQHKLAAAKELVHARAKQKKSAHPARKSGSAKRAGRKPLKKQSARQKPRAAKGASRRKLASTRKRKLVKTKSRR